MRYQLAAMVWRGQDIGIESGELDVIEPEEYSLGEWHVRAISQAASLESTAREAMQAREPDAATMTTREGVQFDGVVFLTKFLVGPMRDGVDGSRFSLQFRGAGPLHAKARQ